VDRPSQVANPSTARRASRTAIVDCRRYSCAVGVDRKTRVVTCSADLRYPVVDQIRSSAWWYSLLVHQYRILEHPSITLWSRLHHNIPLRRGSDTSIDPVSRTHDMHLDTFFLALKALNPMQSAGRVCARHQSRGTSVCLQLLDHARIPAIVELMLAGDSCARTVSRACHRQAEAWRSEL
jgi:hypothetical protein